MKNRHMQTTVEILAPQHSKLFIRRIPLDQNFYIFRAAPVFQVPFLEDWMNPVEISHGRLIQQGSHAGARTAQ